MEILAVVLSSIAMLWLTGLTVYVATRPDPSPTIDMNAIMARLREYREQIETRTRPATAASGREVLRGIIAKKLEAEQARLAEIPPTEEAHS